MTRVNRLCLSLVFASGAALTGCASGNTSSFTQAPLFFSDQVAQDGTATDTTQQVAAADAVVAGDFAGGVPSYLTVGGNAVLPVNRVLVAAIDTTLAAGPGGLATSTTANVGQIANAGVVTSVQPGGVAIGANVGVPVLGGTSVGVNPAVNGVPLVSPTTVQPGITASLGGTNLALNTPVALGAAPLGGALATVGSVLGRTPAAPIVQTLPNTLIQTTSTTLMRTCLLKKC